MFSTRGIIPAGNGREVRPKAIGLALFALLAPLLTWGETDDSSAGPPRPTPPVSLSSALAGSGPGPSLAYYFAGEVPSAKAGLPTPEAFFGFSVGSRHLFPHEVDAYLKVLAEASPRLRYQRHGQSHGLRPLAHLLISSPENLERSDEIVAERSLLTDPRHRRTMTPEAMPVVVFLLYGVHGNEASGLNAAPLVAYYLAASEEPWVRELLDHSVILLDPALNPDGLDRFAHWVNASRGAAVVDDPNSREHREGWPSGRTNHYWFDLNRDWLPAVHPESQARLKLFHRWKPNVVGDFHEMGSGSTFFFQPGVPSRINPLIPAGNVELTKRLAAFHADALDGLGSFYFTEERFDDFFMGKGSTYPDLNGAVGMLFEQASSRGLLRETAQGRLDFPFTIRNQVAISFSTLRGAFELRDELVAYQRRFYQEALAEALERPFAGYLVAAPGDPARLADFLRILNAHGIEARALKAPFTHTKAGPGVFEPDWSAYIPLAQRQYRYLETLFERRKEFADDVFYDVSTWTLPLAFGLEWIEVDRDAVPETFQPAAGFPSTGLTRPPGTFHGYLLETTRLESYALLDRLLAAGGEIRVAMEPFTAQVNESNSEPRFFHAGSVLLRGAVGEGPAAAAIETMPLPEKGRQASGIHGLTTGLTAGGIDLGSPNFKPVERPRIALLTGDGVSAYSAGEIWYTLDKRHGLPVSLLEARALPLLDLNRYNVLIVPDGEYQEVVTTVGVQALREWVSTGNTLIGIAGGARWMTLNALAETSIRKGLDEVDRVPGNGDRPPVRLPYAQADEDRARQQVRGAIFLADVDRTHPLGFGFGSTRLPLFRTTDLWLARSSNPYCTPVAYADEEPWLAGYISPENLEGNLAGSASVVVDAMERGRSILMVDRPAFRGFWRGSERLLLNAVFFGQLTTAPPTRGD